MGKIVLLAVAAAWAAVLLPPLLRSRMENRPNSSVTDFRRQLSTLQRTVPTRTMVPMRAIGRPLTQGPLSRPAVSHRAGDLAGRVVAGRPTMHGAGLARRTHATQAGGRTHDAHRQMHVARVSAREAIRRRRANVLFVLAGSVGVSLFLAATTKSDAMLYLFALAFVSLCGYCYKLVQLRQVESDRRRYGDAAWFHAA